MVDIEVSRKNFTNLSTFFAVQFFFYKLACLIISLKNHQNYWETLGFLGFRISKNLQVFPEIFIISRNLWDFEEYLKFFWNLWVSTNLQSFKLRLWCVLSSNKKHIFCDGFPINIQLDYTFLYSMVACGSWRDFGFRFGRFDLLNNNCACCLSSYNC